MVPSGCVPAWSEKEQAEYLLCLEAPRHPYLHSSSHAGLLVTFYLLSALASDFYPHLFQPQSCSLPAFSQLTGPFNGLSLFIPFSSWTLDPSDSLLIDVLLVCLVVSASLLP